MMRVRLRRLGVLCCLLPLGLGAGNAGAVVRTAPTTLSWDGSARMDVNSLDMSMTNYACFCRVAQLPGLTFPKGTTKTLMSAAGLWIGTKVEGELRVSASDYSVAYGPGKILSSGLPVDLTLPEYQLYRIETGDTTGGDYRSWPCGDGAPCLPDGKPQMSGDQTIWSVYNDISPNRSQLNTSTREPLGVEIQQTTFGFNRSGELGHAVFMRFKIVNPPTGNDLHDMYVSVWSDPDLGGAFGARDDVAGCDTTLSLGYCYNSTNSDAQYGSSPPAVGFAFLQGPVVPAPGDTAYVDGRAIPDQRNLPMTSFMRYDFNSDPTNPLESYNYMQGLWSDGSPVIDPNTGQPTPFLCPGDPVSGTGSLDPDPNDQRMILSSGPFHMAPGDTQTVVCALIVGQGGDRLTSVTAIKDGARFARTVFEAGFDAGPAVFVYPGDSGNDGVVDTRDILPIGLYFDLTGPARPNGSLAWESQHLPGAWNPPQAGYADCDGNGRVNALDVRGIIENWNARRGLPAPVQQDRRRVCLELLAAVDQSPDAPGMPRVRSMLLDYLENTPPDPPECRLAWNQPNPFRGSTSWTLTVPAGVEGRFSICDPGGRLVWSTTIPAAIARSTAITWDGMDLRGEPVPSGIYYYRLGAGAYRAAGKAMLLK